MPYFVAMLLTCGRKHDDSVLVIGIASVERNSVLSLPLCFYCSYSRADAYFQCSLVIVHTRLLSAFTINNES